MYVLGQVLKFADGQIVTVIKAIPIGWYVVQSTTGAQFIAHEKELTA